MNRLYKCATLLIAMTLLGIGVAHAEGPEYTALTDAEASALAADWSQMPQALQAASIDELLKDLPKIIQAVDPALSDTEKMSRYMTIAVIGLYLGWDGAAEVAAAMLKAVPADYRLNVALAMYSVSGDKAEPIYEALVEALGDQGLQDAFATTSQNPAAAIDWGPVQAALDVLFREGSGVVGGKNPNARAPDVVAQPVVAPAPKY
jgi:hypothetical protein